MLKIQVKQFLEELKSHNKDQYKIVVKCREIVSSLSTEIDEEIKYGGILFSLPMPFGGVFVSKNHVSFEFSEGAKFDDQYSVLEGGGKLRRHIKFTEIDQIDDKKLIFYVKQAIEE